MLTGFSAHEHDTEDDRDDGVSEHRHGSDYRFPHPFGALPVQEHTPEAMQPSPYRNSFHPLSTAVGSRLEHRRNVSVLD
jgi:hypothetical protein